MIVEWIAKGKPSATRHGVGRRLRSRGDHAGLRFRRRHGRDRPRPRRQPDLLLLLLGSEERARLRRQPGCLRRPLHRRHRRRDRHGPSRQSANGAEPASPTTLEARRDGCGHLRHGDPGHRPGQDGGTDAPLERLGSAILFKLVDIIIGLRPSEEKEREGLDSSITARAPTTTRASIPRGPGNGPRDLSSPEHASPPRRAQLGPGASSVGPFFMSLRLR